MARPINTRFLEDQIELLVLTHTLIRESQTGEFAENYSKVVTSALLGVLRVSAIGF